MAHIMAWKEIQKTYPDMFVLLDSCEEIEEDENRRIVVRGEVIASSKDGKTVYNEYRNRGKLPNMTFGHTKWDKLESEEIPFLGVRPSNDH